MDLKEKRKHYVKVGEDIENNKIYTFLYEVERNEKGDIGRLLNNSNTKLVSENNLENNIVPKDQSSNLVILETKNHLIETLSQK